MLTLRDIMTGNPVTIAPHVTLRDAIQVLTRYGISGMPVVDGRCVVGTLSARDIVDFESSLPGVPTLRADESVDDAAPADDTSSTEWFVDLWEDAGADTVERFRCSDAPEWDHLADHVVAEAMSPVATTFRPSDPVDKAADYMNSTGTHRAVVVEDGVLTGIVSTMDITRAFATTNRTEASATSHRWT